MPGKSVAPSWLTTLRRHVESKPCVLLRLDESDSGNLTESRHGFNTLARPHGVLSDIKKPTAWDVANQPPAPRSTGAHPRHATR